MPLTRRSMLKTAGAAVAAHMRGAPSPITVELDGGGLEVEVSADLGMRVSGPAEPVFFGEFSAEFVDSLE